MVNVRHPEPVAWKQARDGPARPPLAPLAPPEARITGHSAHTVKWFRPLLKSLKRSVYGESAWSAEEWGGLTKRNSLILTYVDKAQAETATSP